MSIQKVDYQLGISEREQALGEKKKIASNPPRPTTTIARIELIVSFLRSTLNGFDLRPRLRAITILSIT